VHELPERGYTGFPDGSVAEVGAVIVASATAGVVATFVVAGAAGVGGAGAADAGTASGVAGFGGGAAGFGGAGFSGLIPFSHAGPEYMVVVKPLVFHFSSKSAAALLGFALIPMTSFQG